MICVSNRGYGASLERLKIYVALVDREAGRAGMVRVIDESGEDYLYPKGYFAEVKVTPGVAKMIAAGRASPQARAR